MTYEVFLRWLSLLEKQLGINPSPNLFIRLGVMSQQLGVTYDIRRSLENWIKEIEKRLPKQQAES